MRPNITVLTGVVPNDTTLYDFIKSRSRYIFDTVSSHHPIFFIELSDSVVIIDAPWETDVEKQAMHIAVRQFCKEFDARSVVFVCESWMATREKIKDLRGRVSEQPDRSEILLVVGEGLVKRCGYFDIMRESSDKAHCGEFHVMNNAMGDMAGIIPDDDARKHGGDNTLH